jgi:putative lipoprotein
MICRTNLVQWSIPMISRNRQKTRMAQVLLASVLAGCAAREAGSAKGDDDPSGEPAAAEAQRIRGEVLVGKDGYGLTPCGSDRQRILTLSSQPRIFLDRFLESGGKLEFFLDAWVREKEGKLEVVAIERAHTEGPRCGAALEAAQFIASGTEPFWSLQISPTGWLLQRPDSPPLQVAAAAPTKIGAGYAWTSVAPKAKVEILPGYCADGMADAASAWQAKISLGDLQLAGCAHRGELPLP